ncbi:hypothetical protein SAMN03159335_07198, partial [Burkholderia cepacia]
MVICRSLLALPTLTVPTGLVPANPPNVTPSTVALLVPTAAVSAFEPAPSATELFVLAMAPLPMATASVPVAVLSAPVEFAWKYLMPWLLMLSIAEPTLLAVDVVPFALYVVYDGAETLPVVGSYVEPPPSAEAVLLPRLSVFVETVLKPVDSEPIELLADDRPVEVDVDSEVIELLVDERPVESEPIELVADDKPVEVDVDSDVIELLADERPVDVEDDSEVTELLVDERPVES